MRLKHLRPDFDGPDSSKSGKRDRAPAAKRGPSFSDRLRSLKTGKSACIALFALAACGAPTTETAAPAGAETPQTENEAEAIARSALANTSLPDPDGAAARAVAGAVDALPPWAPFYPGAEPGLDSGADAAGFVQVGFTTTDPEEKVAAFYLERFQERGEPIDLKEQGVRTIEVSSADGAQITSAILMSDEAGGVSVILKHEGGGY